MSYITGYTQTALKALPIIILAAFLSACSPRGYESFSGYAQGGTYSVKANLRGVSTSSEEIAATIDSLLREIDFSISGYNKSSILSRRNAGETIIPDRHLAALLELSDQFHQLTDAAFDVWAAPLFDIWGFGFKNDSLPSADKVSIALQECQAHKTLNFNAIAQGYSCDVIARYLYSIGVKDMLVDIGEIYCDGLNPKGKAWTIGIDSPIDGNNTPGAELRGVWSSEGKAQGIVTSGNYRKFYIANGKKFAHTIDPRTGYPVDHNLLSATVVAPTTAEADALATACMVLGLDAARTLIESLDQVEACLISSDSIWCSDNFAIVQ